MATPLRIAVVEDYQELRELITQELSKLGHHVIAVSCAESLSEELSLKGSDLMIVDVNLPGENGFLLAQRMRKIQPNIGIIMLTARTGSQDRTTGYESGADIYLTKPVSFPELCAAVTGLGRRLNTEPSNTLSTDAISTLEINTSTLRVKGPSGESTLTTAEFAVLVALARTPGHQLDYWQILDVLKKDYDSNAQRLLEVQISRVRIKLTKVGAPADAIRAIRLKGYQLCYPIRLI
jgi:DNA-binding response OmpR family regulator